MGKLRLTVDFQLRAVIYWMDGDNGGDTMRRVEGLRSLGWGGIMDNSLESWAILWNHGLFYWILDVDVIGQG